jgi:DnaJ-domain-containing protein 1
LHQRGTRREQDSQRRQQEGEAETQQRQRETAAKQTVEAWWNVLEVSPYASPDEVRRSYLRKINESHPDRVASLAPEFRELALNAAYTEAIRERRAK